MKMREALEKIRIIAQTFMDATRTRHVTDSARIDVGDIEDLANAALAAPPRNCDVYDYGKAIRAFEVAENAEEYEDMAEWLYVTAEEKGDGE